MKTSPAGHHDSADREAPFGILSRAFVRLAAAGLVVFHLLLFRERVASLTLLDPVVALRWGAAVALVLGLVRLHRAGVPLLSGRKALVVWSLVAVLHASMVPGVGGLTATLAEADAGLWLALALSGWLLLPGTRAGAARGLLNHGTPRPSTPELVPVLRAACLAALSPRPPPRA